MNEANAPVWVLKKNGVRAHVSYGVLSSEFLHLSLRSSKRGLKFCKKHYNFLHKFIKSPCSKGRKFKSLGECGRNSGRRRAMRPLFGHVTHHLMWDKWFFFPSRMWERIRDLRFFFSEEIWEVIKEDWKKQRVLFWVGDTYLWHFASDWASVS